MRFVHVSGQNGLTPMCLSVPGSIMISGEHAVLHGFPAVAAAIDARITATLQPREDREIHIHSALGECGMSVNHISCEPPFQFAGKAIEVLLSGCDTLGFDLDIHADMDPDVGLGSSAAVTVAVYAVIYGSLHGAIPDRTTLWKDCVDIIRTVQGRGSGADVAASIYGGIVKYLASEGVVAHYDGGMPSCCLYYAGYKTPTAEVIQIVEKHRQSERDMFSRLDERMQDCTSRVFDACCAQDTEKLGLALQEGQAVLEAYGVCDKTLGEMIRMLSDDEDVTAVKISGSGLGDCILVIPDQGNKKTIPYRRIPISIEKKGIREEAYV